MPQVKWRPKAVADTERLYSFLRDKDDMAARRAARVIFHGALLLEASPRIGRPMLDGTGRRELFMAFGAGAYIIRYVLEADNTVVVVRVWHSKEDRIASTD